MYTEQMIREDLKKKYETLDDYLMALEMRINVYLNEKMIIPRMSQLTQKTNQFNLTSKRYSENEIESFIDESNMDVLAISVSDKYGDNGITGLAIIKYEEGNAGIDTCLMSCRIIGRNIELVFFDIIFRLCREKNIKKVFSEYIKTSKNDQVSKFYDKLNFQEIERSDHVTKYVLPVENYQKSNIGYVAIEYGK
jgi:FkbH-like protein